MPCIAAISHMEQHEAPAAFITENLPHTWDDIRKIRRRVGEVLRAHDTALRSAAMMVTSELVENAVKYGEAVPAAPQIVVSLKVDRTRLIVQVVNGCADPAGIEELRERIQEIEQAENKAALYMARLEALLADPLETGKLGLYRIAFEGQFDMRLEYRDNVVSITATRVYQ